MHTQFLLEKYISKDIVGIIIQVREEDYIWNAMQLNIFGRQRIEFCGRNFNNPFDIHKSCNCDCLYDSCRSNIKIWDEIPFGQSKVMMCNYTHESSFEKPRCRL